MVPVFLLQRTTTAVVRPPIRSNNASSTNKNGGMLTLLTIEVKKWYYKNMSRESAEKVVKRREMIENWVYVVVVKPLVDKCDPESLLSCGCLKDEYDSMSKRIAWAIMNEGGNHPKQDLTIEEMANIIAFIRHHDFSMWSKPVEVFPHQIELAKEILSLLPDNYWDVIPNPHQ